MTDGGNESANPHFFVSYAQADRAWAEWIAWTLEDAHYRVLIQAWDFAPGSNWVSGMQEGVARADRTIAVLSADYAESVYGAAEWQAAWSADPAGQARKVLTVRVTEHGRPGLLGQIVSVDVFGVDEARARAELLRAARLAVSGGRGKPAVAPLFPPAVRAVPVPVPFPSGLPAVWSVPWPRNPLFTGRDSELAAIAGRLSRAEGSAAVLPQALHGLGGVGKTQLAVEYAYRHATNYDLVWWVPGESTALAVGALVELASRVGVPAADNALDRIAGLMEVLRRGEPFRRWLVVVDNAETPSDPFGILAVAGRSGHVLVTSRDPAWAGWAQPVEVDVLPGPDAVRLLQRGCERLTSAEAGQLAVSLGNLPLALEQAGSWLATTGMPVATYERLLTDRTAELLTRGQSARYSLPVTAAWTVAVDRVNDPSTVDLLRLLARFGPEPVPLNLFNPTTEELAELPYALADVVHDPLAFADRVAAVCRLGLVRTTSDGLVMHRLVQAVLREHTPTEQREQLRTAVHALLTAADPADPGNPACWPRYIVLYPHALAAGMLDSTNDAALRLVLGIAEALRSSGDNHTAASLSRQTYTLWTTQLGEDHPETITAMHNLACVVREQGDYPAARALFDEVLTRRRRILGEDHPDTFATAHYLARVVGDQGDLSASQAIFDDLLDQSRRILGEDHPDTIGTAHELARVVGDQGDHSTARTMFDDVLTQRRRILGEDHPSTIGTAHELARVVRDQGDHSTARTMFDDVLTQRRRILGEDHPDTLTAASNLAGVFRDLGDPATARAILDDVLTRSRRILGEDHPDTIGTAHELAFAVRDQGDPATARAILDDVLTRSRRILGEDHPSTIAAAYGHAGMVRDQGDPATARAILDDVLTRSRRVLGDDHPLTISMRSTLAEFPNSD
ncbi:FxSxx-COOH system tetratricopeptide repeat protein [Protofrankia coriariae]|uniref:FxSxx-COOH system tetratricopeptide repeat protein n=1 Tax=Protofrankia coriariae TaxID=1562887 RepID=UPI00069AB676|nr:FxSxx-COOH system tetratricopeptide repeat protein [Protofrankia coriariae]